MSEKSREARLRRLARKEDQVFHKARTPFVEAAWERGTTSPT